jgi:hypothetical protein
MKKMLTKRSLDSRKSYNSYRKQVIKRQTIILKKMKNVLSAQKLVKHPIKVLKEDTVELKEMKKDFNKSIHSM